MEQFLNIASVPAITAIVYGIMAGYKIIVNGRENLIRLIPVIAAALGACIGIAAFYGIPGVMVADNALTAILIGGASGLAATGTNQAFKQIYKSIKGKDDDGKN